MDIGWFASYSCLDPYVGFILFPQKCNYCKTVLNYYVHCWNTVCVHAHVHMLGQGQRESRISHPKKNTDSEKDVALYVLVTDHTQTA